MPLLVLNSVFSFEFLGLCVVRGVTAVDDGSLRDAQMIRS
jgi:hypothetical protein